MSLQLVEMTAKNLDLDKAYPHVESYGQNRAEWTTVHVVVMSSLEAEQKIRYIT